MSWKGFLKAKAVCLKRLLLISGDIYIIKTLSLFAFSKDILSAFAKDPGF